MKIRFQSDEDLSHEIIKGAQRRDLTLDFRTAAEAGVYGLPDDVLEIAAKDNRVLVSHDFKTMPRAFAEFLMKKSSPGILIVPQAHSVEYLFMIWAASEAEEWSNRICRIPL